MGFRLNLFKKCGETRFITLLRGIRWETMESSEPPPQSPSHSGYVVPPVNSPVEDQWSSWRSGTVLIPQLLSAINGRAYCTCSYCACPDVWASGQPIYSFQDLASTLFSWLDRLPRRRMHRVHARVERLRLPFRCLFSCLWRCDPLSITENRLVYIDNSLVWRHVRVDSGGFSFLGCMTIALQLKSFSVRAAVLRTSPFQVFWKRHAQRMSITPEGRG